MFNEDTEWKSEAKYLGVILDKTLTYRGHITSARNKGITRLSLDNKLQMYKMIVRPTMLYASPAWGMAVKSHISKLQTVQNKYLRMAFDAPWYVRGNQLHREAGMPTIGEVMLQTAQKAFAKAETHPDELLRRAVDDDENIPNKYKRPKTELVR